MSKVFSEEEMKVRCVIPGARGRIDMPVFSAPITAKENMKRAIYDGVLLLDESLPYEVVELPLPRDSPVELLEPESGPPKEPHGRNAAEKREILDRLYAYRKSAGLGCFEPLAEACGKGITPDLLRRLYSGDEVVPIQVWRQVGAGLGKLGVSKLDTNGG